MEEIGKFLKENRLKHKMTINDISDITKMNINIITNIEKGNIEYFSNDLTYLKYYVKSYASAVNVDYESLEDEVLKSTLEYTQGMETLKSEKIEDLNETIKVKRQKLSPGPRKAKLDSVRSGVDIDWTLISLIVIVTLIGAFLIYSVTVNVLDKDPSNDTPPVVDNNNNGDTDNDDDKDPDETEPDETLDPVVKEVKVTKEDPSTYLISNWQNQDDFSIKTIFGVNTWVQVSVNNQVVNIPNEKTNSKTYATGEELIITDAYTVNDEEIKFKENDSITVRYGIMRGNKFKINGEDYQLDASIADANGGTDVTFKLDADVE